MFTKSDQHQNRNATMNIFADGFLLFIHLCVCVCVCVCRISDAAYLLNVKESHTNPNYLASKNWCIHIQLSMSSKGKGVKFIPLPVHVHTVIN